MGDLFLLSERQMARISPHFPLAHGVPRVDDRRVVSGIVYVIRNGLQWKDAPKEYGPHKTLYKRLELRLAYSATKTIVRERIKQCPHACVSYVKHSH
jgi:transposase